MSINLKNKQEIIKKFGKSEKDSGNIEVQIAMLSQKISELTEHLKSNKKDFQAKRGLLVMVGRRKGMLTYLKNADLDKYRALIKELQGLALDIKVLTEDKQEIGLKDLVEDDRDSVDGRNANKKKPQQEEVEVDLGGDEDIGEMFESVFVENEDADLFDYFEDSDLE